MKTYIALISTLALAACGGSGTTDTTTPAPQPAPTQPISSDGFATQTSQVGDNFDYQLINGQRSNINQSGTSFRRQNIRISAASATSPVEIVIDGQRFELSPLDDDGDASFVGNGREINFSLTDPVSPVLRGGTLTDFTDTRVTAGSLILGYDTNPATIGARTDSTSYTAPVAAILINDEVVAFAPGSLSLTVDFDAGTMSGNADIDLTTSANGVLFQGFDLTLNEASISENGFRGNISLASGGITRTLVGGSYEGRFFGSEAESIGGNITGQFDELGMTTDTFLDGLFLGNQDDMTPPDPR